MRSDIAAVTTGTPPAEDSALHPPRRTFTRSRPAALSLVQAPSVQRTRSYWSMWHRRHRAASEPSRPGAVAHCPRARSRPQWQPVTRRKRPCRSVHYRRKGVDQLCIQPDLHRVHDVLRSTRARNLLVTAASISLKDRPTKETTREPASPDSAATRPHGEDGTQATRLDAGLCRSGSTP